MEKKKIIFILFSLSVGGAERRAATIANYLVKNGFEIEIVLLDDSTINFEIDNRIKIFYLNNNEQIKQTIDNRITIVNTKEKSVGIFNRTKLFFLKYFSPNVYQTYDYLLYLNSRYANKIREFIKNKKDYTIISWMTLVNLSTCYALKRFKNESILVECTSPKLEFPNNHPAPLLKRELYSLAKKIICQTDEAVNYYDYLKSTTKYVIPNPIMGAYPERYTGTRRKIIVSFCRLTKEKNIPLLIDSFYLFLQKKPDYKLYIYGEGAEKERLVSYVTKLGLDNTVQFMNFDTNLHVKIYDCAMFVSSSNREGMSNSMLEAMAIGLPTISTDCGGAAKMLIKNYENGIVVPVNDKKALCEAMTYIVEHPQEAEKMSLLSSEIREVLSIKKIGEKWQQAIID